MDTQIATLQNDILAQEQTFVSVLSDSNLKFAAEAGFAMQLIEKNNYLAKIALQNRQALCDAVVNIAAIGISLNPALRQAYLVPRDGRVCLDISYMGLLHLAQQSGAVQWAQCKIVRANDQFELAGIDQAPMHKHNPFATQEQRGDIIGAYSVIKTDSGDFLTHCMAIADIYAIRDRTESWKAHRSKGVKTPWLTDEQEMIKKTVIKQAYKYWPFRERLARAIQTLNEEGEGINFASEREEVDITPLPDYPDDKFKSNLGRWAELIECGKSAHEIISTVESRFVLSEKQKSFLVDIETEARSK